jgi:adenosylhomocysteine nucleosidase
VTATPKTPRLDAKLGIVTGLAAEAKLVEKAFARTGSWERHREPRVACDGPGPERAAAAAARLARDGAAVLISFGICGGLDPELRPGDLLLAESVLTGDGARHPASAEQRQVLAARLSGLGFRIAAGALLGRDRPLAGAADKGARFAATGARAVDMESLGVARAAQAAARPFLVVRAIADPAERNLPRAALKAIGPDGRLKLFPALAAMYLRPWESPALVRLTYETRLAFDTLETVAARLAEPGGGLFGGD